MHSTSQLRYTQSVAFTVILCHTVVQNLHTLYGIEIEMDTNKSIANIQWIDKYLDFFCHFFFGKEGNNDIQYESFISSKYISYSVKIVSSFDEENNFFVMFIRLQNCVSGLSQKLSQNSEHVLLLNMINLFSINTVYIYIYHTKKMF